LITNYNFVKLSFHTCSLLWCNVWFHNCSL